MPEIIVGTGLEKGLFELVEIIEHQLGKSQGVPRKIVAQADTVVLTAERPGFDGHFERITLRVEASESTAAALRGIAAESPGSCSIEEDGDALVMHCPPVGSQPDDKSREAAEKLNATLDMPEVWHVHGEDYRVEPISTELLFQAMVQYRASDIHLSPGESPVFRVDGQTCHSEILGPLSSVQIRDLIRRIAAPTYWQEFVERKQTSFNFHQVGIGYSRVSAFLKGGAPHCTMRFLPEVVPSFDDLDIPSDTMTRMANLHHGLVLITGMTGSGKTTTAAAIIDYINAHKTFHIITIENPVEYVHSNKHSIISQRSLGTDVLSFSDAVSGALRHDPDVILIGEMRDPDTIRSAINAAATGHLVISTLHSNTACEVVNRVVSFFDPIERDLVRLQLRDCVRAIICQRLVPKVGGGRVPALEILFNDIKPINDGIVAGDTDAIRIGMQQTVGASFLFESYLYKMFKKGSISLDDAKLFSTDQSIFDQMYMGTYSVPRLDSLRAQQA
ncbi:MAG: PilT/PilU family type 4a pilus ATPase [Nitrospiraceae bacterium]|nr:PilT/PilU family type 4a pilus ATPase [Nitrospiraceae bacterium]